MNTELDGMFECARLGRRKSVFERQQLFSAFPFSDPR
jgi:hypothetical protein